MINATYDLPFGRGTKAWERRNRDGDWQVSGIETLQSGLPFTPQLSYNPSNDGDTRNPVRPSWNPAFSGPVIGAGRANTSTRMLSSSRPAEPTATWGATCSPGPSLATLDFSLAKKFAISGAGRLAVPQRVFQYFQSDELQQPEPSGVQRRGTGAAVGDGGRDHLDRDNIAADPVWAEAAVVRGMRDGRFQPTVADKWRLKAG